MLLCSLEVVQIEVYLAEAELCLVVVVIQFDCLNIDIICFLEVLLVMLYLAQDEVEIAPQEVYFFPKIWLIFLVLVCPLQVFGQLESSLTHLLRYFVLLLEEIVVS